MPQSPVCPAIATSSPAPAASRHWILVLVILANIAVAGPLTAALTNTTCYDPDDEMYEQCCKFCWIFCVCDVDE